MNELSLSSILLVDDDEISNLFNRIFIGKLNIDTSVEVASNGLEALDFLELIDKNKSIRPTILPCLLLLDIKMPKMNGWEFLKVYEEKVSRVIRDQIVIVMLTTSEDEGDVVAAMKSPNVKKFIQKPLSEEKFAELINAYFKGINVE